MNGYLASINGNKITIELNEPLDIRGIKRNQGLIEVDIDFPDNRKITSKQNAFIHDLINAIAFGLGYDPTFTKSVMKEGFSVYKGIDDFSVARRSCSVDTANEFIEFLIDFCFDHNIGFKGDHWQLDKATNNMLYSLTMNRICWVCGKPHADLDHATGAVGLGRDRSKIDHTQSRFFTLCREHHNQRHNMGIDAFCGYYQVKPLKLSSNDLKKLGYSNLATREGEANERAT